MTSGLSPEDLPMRRLLFTWIGPAAVSLVALSPATGWAQSEPALRSFFEGKTVELRIDMPGTSEGVNVHVERPFNQREYQTRLKNYGTALRAGERVTVTLVKVKNDLVEFQLAGGGYGTFGDDTSTSANIPDVEKSNRERDLERLVRDEKDPARKRQLERELEDLRRYRERENRRIAAERLIIEDHKRRQLAERRLQGGSRFNLRFPKAVPSDLTPDALMTLLAEFVDFSDLDAPPTRGRFTLPAPGEPRKGMLRIDAEREFGLPVDASQRREGSLTVTTLVFVRGSDRITAEFVEDVLIRFVIGRR
jgi:hypothetical protein